MSLPPTPSLSTLFVLTLIIILSGCTQQPLPEVESDVSFQSSSLASPSPSSSGLSLADDINSSPQSLPQPNPTSQGDTTHPQGKQLVLLSTSKGDILLELYPDQAPLTVKNFLDKANSGFYESLTFHRVESWVVQGGDPQGTGRGGGQMSTELNDLPFKVGSLGVARGSNIEISNDAQFFICVEDCNWLTGQYTNFGQVLEGLDIARQIQVGDTINSLKPQS